MWPQHVRTLLKITLLRRKIFRAERFPFIVWWICNIDLDALLSGTGKGEFVAEMLENDLIPPPSFHLFPLGMDGSSVVYPEERDTLPTVLQLDYEVTLYAIRLALLAREFRQEASFESNERGRKSNNIKLRQGRIGHIQDSLRQLWEVDVVRGLAHSTLPVRAQRLYQHAWALYRTCLIYSHTSMWPGQRFETSPDYDVEIEESARQILQIAHGAMNHSNNLHNRFLVFPLFMAGFANTDGSEKMLAVDMIQGMEQEGLCRNTIATRKSLEAIYERQNHSFMTTGHSLDVDWVEVMSEYGVVSPGL